MSGVGSRRFLTAENMAQIFYCGKFWVLDIISTNIDEKKKKGVILCRNFKYGIFIFPARKRIRRNLNKSLSNM